MTRRAWVLVVIAVLVVVGVGATAFMVHRLHKEPPRVAAGLYRFPATPSSGGRDPVYPPNVTVDGTPLLGLVSSISGDRASVEVKVGPLPTGTGGDTRKAAHAELATGQDMTVDGFVITVVHIWQMPNPDNNAVDVRIAHTSG